MRPASNSVRVYSQSPDFPGEGLGVSGSQDMFLHYLAVRSSSGASCGFLSGSEAQRFSKRREFVPYVLRSATIQCRAAQVQTCSPRRVDQAVKLGGPHHQAGPERAWACHARHGRGMASQIPGSVSDEGITVATRLQPNGLPIAGSHQDDMDCSSTQAVSLF